MQRLTNMYYSQYESSTESEPLYDSDNTDTYEKLLQSPAQVEFFQYIERRNYEEELHELWKHTIRTNANLAKEIKEQCGMAVDLGDNRIHYIYKPVFDGAYIPGIKFRITLMYVKILRKWYISLGRSRLPDIIELRDSLKNGTYHPVGRKTFELVRNIKNLLQIFVERLIFIYQFINNVKEAFKDIDFQVDRYLRNIKVMLKDNGWPRSIEKTGPEDIIILELSLNTNIEVDNITFEYIYNGKVSSQKKKMCIDTLENKIKTFFDLPLMEAFKTFMKEETPTDNESLEGSLPSTSV